MNTQKGTRKKKNKFMYISREPKQKSMVKQTFDRLNNTQSDKNDLTIYMYLGFLQPEK